MFFVVVQCIIFTMALFNLVIGYIVWHYSKAFADIWGILKSFLWFFYHFFSIQVLFLTLFSPWKRMSEKKRPGFKIIDFLSVLIVNTIMRVLGFFMRITLITTGSIFIVLVLVLGILFFILWIFVPLIIIATLIAGFTLLFK